MTEKRFTLLNCYAELDCYRVKDNGKVLSKTEIVECLNALHEENTHIKNTITEMYKNERTQLGKSVLKQLMEAIE